MQRMTGTRSEDSMVHRLPAGGVDAATAAERAGECTTEERNAYLSSVLVDHVDREEGSCAQVVE